MQGRGSEFFPEVVSTTPDGYKAVAYDRLVAPLVAAVKEQQRQLEARSRELVDLRRRMERMETQFTRGMTK